MYQNVQSRKVFRENACIVIFGGPLLRNSVWLAMRQITYVILQITRQKNNSVRYRIGRLPERTSTYSVNRTEGITRKNSYLSILVSSIVFIPHSIKSKTLTIDNDGTGTNNALHRHSYPLYMGANIEFNFRMGAACLAPFV